LYPPKQYKIFNPNNAAKRPRNLILTRDIESTALGALDFDAASTKEARFSGGGAADRDPRDHNNATDEEMRDNDSNESLEALTIDEITAIQISAAEWLGGGGQGEPRLLVAQLMRAVDKLAGRAYTPGSLPQRGPVGDAAIAAITQRLDRIEQVLEKGGTGESAAPEMPMSYAQALATGLGTKPVPLTRARELNVRLKPGTQLEQPYERRYRECDQPGSWRRPRRSNAATGRLPSGDPMVTYSDHKKQGNQPRRTLPGLNACLVFRWRCGEKVILLS
jgi:hypothetical protein